MHDYVLFALGFDMRERKKERERDREERDSEKASVSRAV
jgi:hypothetical protein